jgi:hypothetical protein
MNLNKSLKGSISPKEANSDPELILEEDSQSEIGQNGPQDPKLVPEEDSQSETGLNRPQDPELVPEEDSHVTPGYTR